MNLPTTIVGKLPVKVKPTPITRGILVTNTANHLPFSARGPAPTAPIAEPIEHIAVIKAE
jgi:hypothetical protein